MTETSPPKAEVAALRCSSCAAPIELRAPHVSQRVACGYCGSVMDAADPQLAIIQKFGQRARFKPLIPLGKRGKIRGELMECIGLQRRRVTVEGVHYEWSEYLLWNPYKGFRFLAECNGHWSSIKTTHVMPQVIPSSGSKPERVLYLGKEYTHFQTARATCVYVVGEFNWKVEVGEAAICVDYVCPPSILSQEKAENEITWSIGEYISPETVWQAFGLPGSPRETVGVAPTQPWPYEARHAQRMHLWRIFIAVFMLMEIFFLVTSSGKLVHQEAFEVKAGETERSRVSKVFELDGRTSNVEVSFNGGVLNSWAFFAMALINDDTGEALDFAREVEYYEGYDDGDKWTEGATGDQAYLPSVPAGRYYLRMEPEAGSYPLGWQISIRRDVVMTRFLFAGILLLSIPPLWLSWRRRSFEYQRWLESDHPMEPIVKWGEGDSDDD